MEREEIRKIFELLTAFYPREKSLHSANVQAAWMLVLKNYPYEDVKNSVVGYAAKHKFFPVVADITASLKAEPGSAFSDLGKFELETLRRMKNERKPSQLEKDAIKRMMEWKERGDSLSEP